MINYLLVAIFSYLLGILSVIIFSIIKTSSRCSRNQEKQNRKFIDYGNIAYKELEKRENKEK